MAKKLVSVIIPVYNVEKYLSNCLDSVISQTYNNLEIIVIDDGSTDNSGRICDEYAKKDKRIKVIHKKNGGLSDARNTGLNLHTGHYITFIDSDDWVDNNYIEEQINTAIKTNSDIVATSHSIHYKNRIINLANNEVSTITPKEALKRILYSRDLDISSWAKLYKDTLFKTIRFPKNRLYEDSATTYKLIDLSNHITIKSISTYNYRMNNNSITRNSFNANKFDLIKSTKDMTDYVTEHYPDLRKAAKRRLEYARLSTLTQLAKSDKEYKEYQNWLMDQIREDRLSVLFDISAPLRDKIGLISTYFGFRAFRRIWGAYETITRRRQ
jgi:glycosyltransferase involved in cell wall biosynthesis